MMHLQKTGPCQIHPCRGLCGHLYWEQVTSGSSLSPTNWQRRAKQILQLTAAGIFLQNCLCKKGRVLGVLPLGGTKPSIVRAPAEATCGKRSQGDASPGKQWGESGTLGMGCPSCSRLVVVSRGRAAAGGFGMDLGWVELKPQAGPARRICSDLLGSCDGTHLLQDF